MSKKILAFVLTLALLCGVFVGCAKKPQTPAELISLGEKYLTELDYENAVVQFLKVIEIEPKNVQAYQGAAKAYIALGRQEEAVAILERGFVATSNADIRETLDEVRPVPEPEISGPEPVVEQNGDYVVEWNDPTFEQIIRQRLDKPIAEIYRSELDSIHGIIIMGNTHVAFNEERLPIITARTRDYYEIDGVRYTEKGEISNLNDLIHFHALEWVSIDFNIVSDISSLTELKKLKVLSLCSNNIGDISPLTGLINLDSLSLDGNSISDISPLAGLTNLYNLSLYDNRISDVSALADLINLKMLGVGTNSISDVSPLAKLTSLETLGLTDNNISDISPLSGLINLKMLILSANSISDISPLSGLTNLQTLSLGANDISDWSPVSHVEVVHGRH